MPAAEQHTSQRTRRLQHEDRLHALTLMPFFYILEQDPLTNDMDATPYILRLRQVLKRTFGIGTLPAGSANTMDPGSTLSCNDNADSLKSITRSHILTFHGGDAIFERAGATEDQKGPFRWRCSWLGLTITRSFLMQLIPGTSETYYNGSQPMDSRMLRRMFTILKKDFENTEEDVRSKKMDPDNRDFWFFRVVVAALILAEARLSGQTEDDLFKGSADSENSAEAFRSCFNRHIRTWSATSGITRWNEAHEALGRVVWLEELDGPVDVERVWEEAMVDAV